MAKYDPDDFHQGTDSPAYRGADGTFLPDEKSPEFPKSDGLPSVDEEFVRSPGASEIEGAEHGGEPVPDNGETAVGERYREEALPGQQTKIEEATDEQSNIRQDFSWDVEQAKAKANVPDGREGKHVDADSQGVGEARAKDSVEQTDPDKAVEAENAKVEAAADGATDHTETQKQIELDRKEAEHKAEKHVNEERREVLDEAQKAAKEDSTSASEAQDVAKATPAADQTGVGTDDAGKMDADKQPQTGANRPANKKAADKK